MLKLSHSSDINSDLKNMVVVKQRLQSELDLRQQKFKLLK